MSGYRIKVKSINYNLNGVAQEKNVNTLVKLNNIIINDIKSKEILFPVDINVSVQIKDNDGIKDYANKKYTLTSSEIVKQSTKSYTVEVKEDRGAGGTYAKNTGSVTVVLSIINI